MFFYYPEEDNVFGQHAYETSLNDTNTEEIRDVTANCFCFCHIINSLLTELVRSIQEGCRSRSFFAFLWTSPTARSKKAKKELDRAVSSCTDLSLSQ